MAFEENVQPNVAAVLLFPCWGSRFPTLVGVDEVEILNSKERRIALPLQYPPPLGSRTLAHRFTHTGKCNWCVCECAHLSAFVCVSEFAALIKLPAFPLRCSPQGALVFPSTCLFRYNCVHAKKNPATRSVGVVPVQRFCRTATQSQLRKGFLPDF